MRRIELLIRNLPIHHENCQFLHHIPVFGSAAISSAGPEARVSRILVQSSESKDPED